jgi:hypothetical protein
MRNTWRSRKAERTTVSSSRAEAPSRPNGFSSTTALVEERLRESPASPRLVVTSGKTVGGVAR